MTSENSPSLNLNVMHQGNFMVTLQYSRLSPCNLCSRILGGSPWMRRSSREEVACIIVSRALARSHSSLGNDFDRLVVQTSLATLPLKLVIISDHTIPYSVTNAQSYQNCGRHHSQAMSGNWLRREWSPLENRFALSKATTSGIVEKTC